MRVRNRLILSVVVVIPVVVLLANPDQPPTGPELAVCSSLLPTGVVGPMTHGVVTVEVLNLTSTELVNVQLTLQGEGPNRLEQNVVLVGNIPGNGVRVATANFQFEPQYVGSGRPLVWQVDYDDAAATHKQIIVPGPRAE